MSTRISSTRLLPKFQMSLVSPIFGLLAGYTAWLYANNGLTDDRLYSIATAIAAFSGTALGFLITALSVFTALFSRDLVQRLFKTGHFTKLVRLMFCAAAVFMVTAIACLAALFLNGSAVISLVSLAVGLTVTGSTLLAIAGYQFYLVLIYVK